MARTNVLATIFALLATSANADISISNKPTQNMDCEAGVCTATAQQAVLNVADLQTMLASGDVAVKTGSLAKDIDVDQPLTWATTSRLTLDAQQSVTVKKPVTISGTGNLTIVTNDGGGKHGEFIIVPEHGSIQFWDFASSLIIDGNSYILVDDIKTLAADIAANPSGFYAFAKPYDASGDGTYSSSPVPTEFNGTFEGLGNQISNFAIQIITSEFGSGLFHIVEHKGIIRDLQLTNLKMSSGLDSDALGGGLVGDNDGTIERCLATGNLQLSKGAAFGGLAGVSDGKIAHSYAVMQINAGDMAVGGLIGGNDGIVTESYSKGSIRATNGLETFAGGLVGDNTGTIHNTYSMSSVHNGRNDCCDLGGLVGRNEGNIASSYSAGKTSQGRKADHSFVGGVVGEDKGALGSIANSYWDLDIGISNPAQGAGNIPNDPGITGLTDAQLKSGLPAGFDPKIWGSDPKINNGYPYLLANPPR